MPWEYQFNMLPEENPNITAGGLIVINSGILKLQMFWVDLLHILSLPSVLIFADITTEYILQYQ
jgi:hypothetical protein